MALVGVELETFVSKPDALTTLPPPCALAIQDGRTISRLCICKALPKIKFISNSICGLIAADGMLNNRIYDYLVGQMIFKNSCNFSKAFILFHKNLFNTTN